MWKSQKGFVFCRIMNSTNLSPSKVLELLATLNSVLPKSAVTVNTSRYFVISEAFVLPQGAMPCEVARVQQYCVLLSFVLNTKNFDRRLPKTVTVLLNEKLIGHQILHFKPDCTIQGGKNAFVLFKQLKVVFWNMWVVSVLNYSIFCNDLQNYLLK